MANHVSHAALPYPVKGCRFTIQVPYLDADGDPTDPTTPDTERSIDGAAFADCTEEVTTITGGNGVGYLTLTGDEMNASIVALAAKVASGPKATLGTLYPRVLPLMPFSASGTAQGGAAGSITLQSDALALDDAFVGCIIRTTGGTGGGGGSGSRDNQARIITDYVGSTLVASVSPNWETTPGATTTYEILLTEFALYRFADLQLWLAATPLALNAGLVQAQTNQVVANAITAASIGANAIGASELATDAIEEIADGILGRTTAAHEAAYTETVRSLYGLIAGMQHKREISGANVILYKSDDATVLATIPITTDATLDPIKVVDPP